MIRPIDPAQLTVALSRQDRAAQKTLYDQYAPSFFGLCRRYIRDYHEAEDVMIGAFYKIMTNIEQYTGKGNFEGWMRRIVVNECLMHLRKRHTFQLSVEVQDHHMPLASTTTVDQLLAEDILSLLDELPVGYRTVFNLFVLEGYKHREIAELLGISINTSKSQLILAKKRLREKLERLQYPDVG